MAVFSGAGVGFNSDVHAWNDDGSGFTTISLVSNISAGTHLYYAWGGAWDGLAHWLMGHTNDGFTDQVIIRVNFPLTLRLNTWETIDSPNWRGNGSATIQGVLMRSTFPNPASSIGGRHAAIGRTTSASPPYRRVRTYDIPSPVNNPVVFIVEYDNVFTNLQMGVTWAGDINPASDNGVAPELFMLGHDPTETGVGETKVGFLRLDTGAETIFTWDIASILPGWEIPGAEAVCFDVWPLPEEDGDMILGGPNGELARVTRAGSVVWLNSSDGGANPNAQITAVTGALDLQSVWAVRSFDTIGPGAFSRRQQWDLDGNLLQDLGTSGDGLCVGLWVADGTLGGGPSNWVQVMTCLQ